MFHRYIASVLYGCWIIFSMAFQVFLGVFANVSDTCFNVLNACFKCFISLHTYVANVSSESLKNRSGVAVGDPPACVRAREVDGA
jgi:hypothetical protein